MTRTITQTGSLTGVLMGACRGCIPRYGISTSVLQRCAFGDAFHSSYASLILDEIFTELLTSFLSAP